MSTLAAYSLIRTHRHADVDPLIRAWHSTHPYPRAMWMIAFLITDPDGQPVAVATWDHPTAPKEDQSHTLELTRYAIGPTAPRNLGTWGLGRMRHWIRAHLPHISRLISYHDADAHHGTIYRADNWLEVYHKRKPNEGPWSHRPGRRPSQRTHKVKWERTP